MQGVTWGATALVLVLGLTGAASAQGPTFDCSKASGDVETLICKDAGLAALDRTLDGVYKAAMKKARDGMPARLKADQRGFISGRNDCWKTRGAPSYLTASWQATTVRECVEGNYKLRISDLQAQWQLVPAKPPVSYVCGNNPANEVVATFFETDPATARLERGDKVQTVWQVPLGERGQVRGPERRVLEQGHARRHGDLARREAAVPRPVSRVPSGHRRVPVTAPPAMPSAGTADTRGLALGFASHLLAGVSPFIVAEVIARTDPLPGTALVYGFGAAVLAVAAGRAALAAAPARGDATADAPAIAWAVPVEPRGVSRGRRGVLRGSGRQCPRRRVRLPDAPRLGRAGASRHSRAA